jgi:hypothetical protein
LTVGCGESVVAMSRSAGSANCGWLFAFRGVCLF